jgi:hypothetical protein
MQLTAATAHSTTSSTADEQRPSPMASNSSSNLDPLVVQTAKKLAIVINDFKRELDRREGSLVETRGTFEISLSPAQTYELTIVQDEDGHEYPITVQARQKKDNSALNGEDNADLSSSRLPYTPKRRASDTDLEKDIVSRRKRKLDEEGFQGHSRKRLRGEDEEEEDALPLISKDDMEDLLAKLREDIQEDTTECVNHVQKLLRRFKEEWHEKSKWEYEKLSALQSGPAQPQMPVRSSTSVERNTMPEAFPSPSMDRDDHMTPLQDFIRREAKLLSTQIKWVEDCRRIASDAHDKREETWRTSSASFHDRNRQDREAFQARMINDSNMHARMLTQILNEVKSLSNVTMSLKWETPDHQIAPPQPSQQPAVPAFPTQPVPPAFPTAPPPSKR